MSNDDAMRLRHILDASREAMTFARGRSRNDLETDHMLNLSLVRLLEIVGEAARALSSETCAAHPGIPWKQMRGMRDRLVHGYFDVNLDIVWETVTKDLPPLITALEPIVPKDKTS